ncbi:MAG: M20/M25/M40 family metallo-hydrolase [Vulcanimicrobiaceae bacterium]
MLDLVRDLVAIPSHSSQAAGTNAVGDLICQELEAIGYSSERLHGERLPAELRWLEEMMLAGYDPSKLGDQRVARWHGSGHGKIVLLGDVDTAFTPEKLFPFRVEAGRALGPGIADMKGGLAVAVYALKALHATGYMNLAEVTCVFSSDEQSGSLDSRKLIEESARDANWVFCMECARNGADLMGSRAQTGVAKLEVFGREAHAGSAYGTGVNAIEAMARKIAPIQALTDSGREIFLSVGQISGGWRRSVVPGHCAITIDIRTPGSDAWNEIEAKLRRIADNEDVPGSHSSLLIASHRPALPWTADTDKLIAITREAGNAVGVKFDVIRSPAAGSSAFVGPLGVPCLDGMGPVGGDLMTDQEFILIPTLAARAALLATTMHALGAGAWSI